MSHRIVALGGGHGLYATLSAARRLTPYVTAVVTVADDGGSSGRLRGELDIIPPGDLRMALAALASDSPYGRLWATIIQHRFGGTGALAGHPIGNLMLAGLNEVLGDPVAALDELGRVLGVKGRVLPMCPIALQIEADVAGLESDPRMSRVIRGQVAIATTPGKVRRVRLLPGNPPATRQAVDAIMAADLVVLGPGSWFTSVIPHVLVPELAAALQATRARRALVLNLADEPGETAGFSAERHLHVLSQHAPDFTVNDIIVDASRVPAEREREQLRRSARILDAQVQFADVSRPGTPLHDPAKLAAALEAVRMRGDVPVPPTAPTPAPGVEGPTVNVPRGDYPWR
ncbi:gluconeogenesis factor YvcK family protein [Mycolicibacterium palauense]|uniref:gluconeogenesis factor YvcK family protein n=1 Tax=Mycolicibacterium palauense TaxID=2034511 RepID=UPI000BFEBCF6|nr:uridine diphosphate-N-acetylglucosamine-binding protein YvcK [Mycolicibacterium palauense]